MGITDDNKGILAFKNLFGKSNTDVAKELGNESEGIFFNVGSDDVWVTQIDSDPSQAVIDGSAQSVNADLIEDASSNGHAFFAVYPTLISFGIGVLTIGKRYVAVTTAGHNSTIYGIGEAFTAVNADLDSGTIKEMVKGAISPQYGNGYEAKPFEGATPIPIGDARNWVMQYNSGVFYQQDNVGNTPTTIDLHVYIGNTLATSLGGTLEEILANGNQALGNDIILDPATQAGDGSAQSSPLFKIRGNYDSDPTAGITSTNVDTTLQTLVTLPGGNLESSFKIIHDGDDAYTYSKTTTSASHSINADSGTDIFGINMGSDRLMQITGSSASGGSTMIINVSANEPILSFQPSGGGGLNITTPTLFTGTRTATFQDASGIIAYLSDITGNGNTLYTADDSLTGIRSVAMAGFGLTFGGGQTNFVGAGDTSATKTLSIQNSALTEHFYVRDDGAVSAKDGYSIDGTLMFHIGTSTGINNLAIGSTSLLGLTNGHSHVAIGNNALFTTSGGFSCTAIGFNAGYSWTTAQYNTAIGTHAGYTGTYGVKNTSIGAYAGSTNIGQKNTMIGYLADVIGNFNASIAIGAGATVTASNQAVFGGGGNDYIGSLYLGGGVSAISAFALKLSEFKIQVTSVEGTDQTPDLDFIIAGSQGTGTGSGGDLIFKTAPSGLTGSTANPLVSIMTIGGNGDVNITGLTDANLFYSDYSADRIGVGINIPTARLHIKGLGATSATTSLLVTNSSGTPSLQVLDNGSVGMGIVPAAGALLDVNDRVRIREGSSGDAGIWFYQGAADKGFLGYDTDNLFRLYDTSKGGNLFSINTTTATFVINLTDAITGTNSASRLVVGANTTDALALERRTSTVADGVGINFVMYSDVSGTIRYAEIEAVINSNGTGVEEGSLHFKTRASGGAINTNMAINPIGDVGIGLIDPTARLHIKGLGATSATTSLLVTNSSGTPSLQVLDNGFISVNDATLLASEKLGILGGLSITSGDLISRGNGNIVTNVAVGIGVFNGSTTGSYSVAIGYYAANSLLTGLRNTVVGGEAYRYNTAGSDSSIFGRRAGYYNTGGQNVISGSGAGAGTSGLSTYIGVVISGYAAGGVLTTGNYSTLIGNQSGISLTIGVENTFVGNVSGRTNITGNRNIFLGHESGYYETGSDKLFIDNDKRTDEATARISALIYGEFNTTVSSQTLRFNASVGIGVIPDASALLDMVSTTQGFAPPSMTGAQAESIVTPKTSLIVYTINAGSADITTAGWWGWDGANWRQLG